MAKSLHNAFSDDDNNDVHNYPDDYDHHVILMMFMMVPVFVGLLNGTLAVGLVPGKYIKRHLVKIYDHNIQSVSQMSGMQTMTTVFVVQ